MCVAADKETDPTFTKAFLRITATSEVTPCPLPVDVELTAGRHRASRMNSMVALRCLTAKGGPTPSAEVQSRITRPLATTRGNRSVAIHAFRTARRLVRNAIRYI